MEITKKINGTEYGFKFTPLTTKKVCDYKKINLIDIEDYISKNPTDGINALFRAAIDVYSKGEKSLNEYEMDELIEQMSDEDFTDIYTCSVESQQGWITKIQSLSTKAKKK